MHAGKHMKAASWYLFLLKWPKFWPESFWGWKWNQKRDVQGGMFLWTCSRAFVFRLIDVWRSFQMEVFSMKRIWRDGYSVAGGRLYIIGLGAAFRPLNEGYGYVFPMSRSHTFLSTTRKIILVLNILGRMDVDKAHIFLLSCILHKVNGQWSLRYYHFHVLYASGFFHCKGYY